MSKKVKKRKKAKTQRSRAKTGIILFSTVLLTCLIAALSVIYINSKQLVIEFYEGAEVSINEPSYNYDFVKTMENGEILTEKTLVDTSKPGEQTVSLTVKPTFGAEKVFTVVFSVVDGESPVISFADHLKTDVGVEIDLLDGVSATDNSGEEIAVTVEGFYDIKKIGEYKLKYVACDSSLNKTEEEFTLSVVDEECPKITFTDYFEITQGEDIDLLEGVSVTDNSGEDITVSIEGDYDLDRPGVYSLKYVAHDSSGNKAEEAFTLKVKETPPPVQEPTAEPAKHETVTFTTSKGYSGVIINGVTYIDGYLVANKTYSLPSTYGSGLTADTMSAFYAMRDGAASDGLNLYISSGFRSYSYQNNLYNNYVRMDGQTLADTYSARAGHSEHQSGLAFDVNIVGDAFIGTPEAVWLNDNCYKYGFILRYPQGKTNETGYKYEPWHFRYVGVELAEKLYNGGDWITMEDYFGITSVYQ